MFPGPRCGGSYEVFKDPYFSSVSCLLHMDGTNGGSTFTDSGPAALTVTANSGAITDTGTVKFGTAAGNFLHTAAYDAYLTFSSATGFAFPSDFTVEGQINWANNTNGLGIFETGDTSGLTTFQWAVDNATKFLIMYVNGVAVLTGTITITTGAYHHVVIQRASNVITMAVDGVIDSATLTLATSFATTGSPRVGRLTSVALCRGYIDEFRVTKGLARYPGNFVPPIRPFPNF